MATQKLMVDLPEAVYQHLSRIAEQIHQPIEVLLTQSVISNLPPSAENAPPEMTAELLTMLTFSVEKLLKVADSQLSPTQERHLELLEKKQTGSISAEELQELDALPTDQLLLRKTYAEAVLRWRGHRGSAVEELSQEQFKTCFGKHPLKRDQVLAIVAAHQEQLKEMGVKSLDLFGSVARNEARPDSDVDFLVEFDRPVGLFEYCGVRLYLEDILGCSVDMGTLDALREHLREPVLKDVIRVF